jgi:hypothetical protein
MERFLPILPLFLALCSFFLTLKLLIYPGFTFIQQTLNKVGLEAEEDEAWKDL